MTGPCSDNDGAKDRSTPRADGCPFRFGFFSYICSGALRIKPCCLRMVCVYDSEAPNVLLFGL